jgi:hypothetical protein
MRTITAIAAKSLGKFLAKVRSAQEDRVERPCSLARSTMECLGRTDALYHNLEHTMFVTLVGRDILRGRTLTERIEATDYDHLIVACLLHDMGYVRGVLKGDTKTDSVVEETGKTVTLPRGASDAALTPYHVRYPLPALVGKRVTKLYSRGADVLTDDFAPADLYRVTPIGVPKRQ